MTTDEAMQHCFSQLKRKDFDDDIDYNTFRQWKYRYKLGELGEWKQEEILRKLGYKCEAKQINWLID